MIEQCRRHLRSPRVVHAQGRARGPVRVSDIAAVTAGIGIDLADEFPKPLTDDVVAAADCVVSMGCGDACVVYPGKRYLDWALGDPDGQPLGVVRRIRDDLDARVIALLTELTTPVAV